METIPDTQQTEEKMNTAIKNQGGNEKTRGHEEQASCGARSEVHAHVKQTQTHPGDEGDDIHDTPTLVGLVVRRYEGGTCGEGVVRFEGGHIYKGTLSMGLMDGRGVFTGADGLKYDGEFVCNMPTGKGTYTWPDGSSYEGEVRGGVRHGTGTYRGELDAASYTGQWAQGRRHGQGVVYYTQDKTSWYKGDWVRNNREGWGVRRYPSGNVYSGEWKNNLRHGEGTMRWLNLGQQYVGTWHNGVQHGRGTHARAARRADGSRCCHRYSGDFVRGRCEEERRRNETHGKDGDVFEGEMMILNLTAGKASTAPPDVPLNIECLLQRIPETKRSAELKQVEFAVLRERAELRSAYSFYSGLGRAPSPGGSFLLSRLQLWRLLKDCNVHRHGISPAQMDRFIGEGAPPAEIRSPFAPIRLGTLLSCLVIAAFHIYHKDAASENHLLAACFSKLMTDNVLPNYKNVKGFVFRQPDCAAVAVSYSKRSWDVYQAYNRGRKVTCRHLLGMFKDLRLLDTNLTPARLLQIITAESRDRDNPSACLDVEITFLEFFEVLLGSAEVTCQRGSEALGGGLSSPSGPEAEASERVTETRKSNDAAETSTDQNAESQQDVETKASEKPPSAGQSSETKEEPSRGIEARGCEVELRKQTIHQFFKHVFFPAFEHNQLVSRRIEEEKLRREAQRPPAQPKPPPEGQAAPPATHS
uniref:LOW QUALITY PROTEIN: radial spoke head 10 homolog B n=1 Tax=Gasterosteus aculeatus aculeatus TaxID=481459 RepID=UPI001A98E072|nr:LOW QUALITY PROTEIN: radial spoke head 10 homolog B [Gasterosteus aculeatus aculeatus]